MLACRAGRRTLPGVEAWAFRVYRRSFGTSYTPSSSLPPLRIAGPVTWCITAIGTIYFGCAAFEVRREAKLCEARHGRDATNSYEELAAAIAYHKGSRAPLRSRQSSLGDSLPVMSMWNRLDDLEKLRVGNIAVCSSFWVTERLTRAHIPVLMHQPIGPRNYTMFTSMFGHAGALHLLVNMYCFYQIGGIAARSRTFDGSGSHLAAFYLSSGVLASLATHLEAALPSRRLRGSLGASGAIMALLGIFGMSFPEARLGVLFVPGSLPAQEALGWIAAFDTFGLIFGIPFLKLAHSGHLAGLGAGCAYVYFDGKNRLWEPTRKLAFRGLRAVSLI